MLRAANNNDDTNPSKKKLKSTPSNEADEALTNLLALYSGDLGEQLISYSSASELCKLDLLNRQFRELTEKIWTERADERFGMKNGKDGWRMGTSFLREPVFIHINRHPTYGDMYYAGSPHVTANNDLVAVDTDDGDPDVWAPNGIGLYRASDLTYLGPREQGGGWKTTVAGPAGNHLFVSYLLDTLCFSRGDITHREHFQDNRNSHGIPHIANETHVIVVIGNTLHLYRIISDNRLVEMCQTNRLGREAQNDNDEHFEFIVYHSIRNLNDDVDEPPATSTITVWSLNAGADSMSQTKSIDSEISLRAIVLGKDFIAGSCMLKKIHVWDRHTERKKEDVLCDVEEDDELSPDDIIYPLHLSCHGHMLVSTSHIGAAICIWNLKTEKLLRRYNNVERFVDALPLGDDATSMAYLKPLNAYICVCGCLNILAFPTNQQQSDTAKMIKDREWQNGYGSQA